MAKLDNGEIHVLVHALREPLNALTRDIAMLDREGLPPSIERIAKAIGASMDRVLIALAEVESVLEKSDAKPTQRGR